MFHLHLTAAAYTEALGRNEKGVGVDMYFRFRHAARYWQDCTRSGFSVFTYSTKSFEFCTDESFGPTSSASFTAV